MGTLSSPWCVGGCAKTSAIRKRHSQVRGKNALEHIFASVFPIPFFRTWKAVLTCLWNRNPLQGNLDSIWTTNLADLPKILHRRGMNVALYELCRNMLSKSNGAWPIHFLGFNTDSLKKCGGSGSESCKTTVEDLSLAAIKNAPLSARSSYSSLC